MVGLVVSHGASHGAPAGTRTLPAAWATFPQFIMGAYCESVKVGLEQPPDAVSCTCGPFAGGDHIAIRSGGSTGPHCQDGSRIAICGKSVERIKQT